MSYSGTLTATSRQALEEVNWLEREFPDPAEQREYAQERCIVAVTEALGAAMERANVNRAELAKRLGVTKGHISQLFGGRNLTLRSIADVLWACDLELHDLELSPLGVMMVPLEHFAEWKCAQAPSGVEAKGSLEVNLGVSSSYSPQARRLDMYTQHETAEASSDTGQIVHQEHPKAMATTPNGNLALAA